MQVNMDPSVRYVTQSYVYSLGCPGKLLTDRRIKFYQNKGLYGTGLVLRNAVKKKSTPKRKKMLEMYK